MERWLRSDDRDVLWIMKENLGKQRLIQIDPAWVARWRPKLASRVGRGGARRRKA